MAKVILFRAQPFHNGHLNMVKMALRDCKPDERLYIFLGSADKSNTIRNPFSAAERSFMIEYALYQELPKDDWGRVMLTWLDDLTTEEDNSYEWGQYLYDKVCNTTQDSIIDIYYADHLEIITSWFSKELEDKINIIPLERKDNISATRVRQDIVAENWDALKAEVPKNVYDLRSFLKDRLDKINSNN